MSRVTVIGATRTFGAGSEPSAGRRSGVGYSDRRPPGQSAEVEDLPQDKLTTSGRVRALDNVSLEIADGETLCVIGPSGCGKTTLLRVIAGLETLDSGRVLYDDQDVTDMAPKDRGIGIVFQNYALYPHMDSKKNLSFFFWMHKRDREIDERVRITSEILGVGFDQLLERRPKQLSGGQQQRVAIGRCIIRDPRLFLFDEPLSNLDAKLRAKTRVEVKRLLSRFRITTIYVTHDQTEAIALADRIAVMRHGRIEQIGTYWEIFDHPINLFVAGFVGLPPMNVYAGTVADAAVAIPLGLIPLGDAHCRVAVTGRSVSLGIRPEHVRLAHPSEPGHFRGEVEVVEVLPSDRRQIVHVLAAGVEITASVPIEPAFQRGDTVSVVFPAERIHLFDGSSEANLLAQTPANR